jgi:ribosomal protein L21E
VWIIGRREGASGNGSWIGLPQEPAPQAVQGGKWPHRRAYSGGIAGTKGQQRGRNLSLEVRKRRRRKRIIMRTSVLRTG